MTTSVVNKQKTHLAI